jgi:hypothetical protein
MAGTAKSYNTAYVELGPGDVWIDVATPGAGARVTIHTDGTPESVANPSAEHLGMTLDGARIIYTPQVQNFNSDEQTAPIISQIGDEELRLEGTSLQILDTNLMNRLIAGSTFGSGSGYEQNTVGGKQTLTTFSVLYVAPIFADTTKFLVVSIYKAYNAAGWNTPVTRKGMSGVPFNFFGLSISSGAAGDQLGSIWKTVA